MPHFGLVDEKALSREEALLLRARLHWRGGRERLLDGRLASGITSLYDALVSAMEWRLHREKLGPLHRHRDATLEDDRLLCEHLLKQRFLAPEFDFRKLQDEVENILEGRACSVEPGVLLAAIAEQLTRLGLLPFDESELPPEKDGEN